MSLRRRSCDACFKRRQKCDRTYPVCKTCQRLNKPCHYPFAQPEAANRESLASGTFISAVYQPSIDQDASTNYFSDVTDHIIEQGPSSDYDSIDLNIVQPGSLIEIPAEVLKMSIPDLLGPLGELQPLTGNTRTWQWVAEHFKAYPREFVLRGKTTFMHEQLYHGSLPRPLGVAFTVSAACNSINEDNQSIIFKILDREVLEILQLKDEDLLQDLAKLQALVLYHIMRLFYGGIEQRAVADMQERLLQTRALQLLQRARIDVRGEMRDWESWILAESIRRTVLATFLLCGVHSILTQGICLGFPTLRLLPISSEATPWISQAKYMQDPNPGETTAYNEFTDRWICAPRDLESFEKLLVVACKGIEVVEACSDLML